MYGRGRQRVYCSRACKDKFFRRTNRASKNTEADRRDLVNKHLFAGDWRLGRHFADWPRYTCLACGVKIQGQIEAWYDFQSWNQVRGVLTRLLCSICYTMKGGQK